MPTTVVLADDHPMFRKGLRLLLDAEEDILVVGEAGDGLEAIEKVRELAPDVVVMDISMPGLNGIEATKAIVSEFPGIRVVALSIQSSKRFIDEMLRAGAAGYILKESAPEELIDGIKSVIRGEVFLSAAVTKTLVTELIEKDPEPQPASPGGGISADTGYEIPLLRTKLQRPFAPPDLVVRSHLLDRLDEMRRRSLTLVSAPAGCGKSSLASQWLEVFKGYGFWLSLDKDDNDLRLFLSYIVAAIRSELPTACEATSALLEAALVPPIEAIGRHFLNDLDEIGEPCILVLDDYHNIRNKAVHDLISVLLLHPSRHLHLMLLCRRDPPLPISRLRARGEVNEFGISDLRFTQAETTAYLQKRIAFPLDETRAATIYEKIEGWPAGIRLLSQSLVQHADPYRLIEGLKGGFASILDFLLAEVLLRQPTEMAEFMLATSILNRFCAPLCESLLSTGDTSHADKIGGAEFIAWMQRENLFLIPLDSENKWFRYHHLFQDLLKEQLKLRCSSEQITTYHYRASRWFAENDLLDEALRHAIATNDLPYAAKLAEQHCFDLMNQEKWNQLEHVLKMLPVETVEKNPILLITRAFIHEYRGQIVESFADRDLTESLLSTLEPEWPEQNAVQGMIAVLHGEQFILSGEGERAIECAERALRVLPAAVLHIRSYGVGTQVLGYQMAGDFGAGLKIINEILNERALLPGITQTRLMLWLCLAHWMEGDLIGLKQPALQCLKLGEQHALQESISFGRYFLGAFHYVRNELSEAERYLAAVVKEPFACRPQYLVQSAFALARIYTSQNRDDEASNVIESVISHVLEANDTVALAVARAFQVELALRQKKIPEAQRLNEHATYEPYPPIWFLYVPQLTPVKLLFAQNTSDSLEKAVTLLDQIDGFVRKTNRKTIRIDVLALQALTLDAQGKEPDAIERLSESLTLAEPGGFIRNFVDMGLTMADLLKRLQKQNVAADYIEKLLTAFGDDEQVIELQAADHHVASPHQPRRPATASQPLVEPLTNREIDVLELLAQRLQNKEIADKLFVATETVKAHLKNIYQKLGVSKRREAVARAIELGILSGR